MGEEPDYEKMAAAMDSIVETLNVVRKRLIAEGYTPESAERLTVGIFLKVWAQ